MRTATSMLAGLAVTAAITAGPALAGGPHAGAARTCSLAGRYQRLGPSYVETLEVRGVACKTGERVVSAYYRCRLRSGGLAGHCHNRVLGFACRERRSGIPVQFDARVTCTRGRAMVVHRYTQNV